MKYSQTLEDPGGHKSAENGARELKHDGISLAHAQGIVLFTLVNDLDTLTPSLTKSLAIKRGPAWRESPSAVIGNVIGLCMTELRDRKHLRGPSDVAQIPNPAVLFASNRHPVHMRNWARLLVISAVAAVGAASDQQPFQQHAAPVRAFDKTSSTGNLIFSSVSSLLQHWPNTRYITGMTTFR